MAHKNLQGQVAIITGGGRGIGKAAAYALARLGVAVVVTARSIQQVEDVAAALRAQGASALALSADVADPAQVETISKRTLEAFGRVDILVNNAGIIWPVDEVVDSDPKEWAYNIQVNLLGPFYLTRAILPEMIKQGSGRIVSVSSGAAINPILGASAYSTAKAGLDMFTRALAHELASTGVTVNSFHPGMVDTEMQTDLRSVDTSGAAFDLNRFHDAFQQRQLRAPDDVAQAIAWLSGPWSGEHSGKIFRITDAEWIRQVNTDLNTAKTA
jgi:NAD(P)-dependent dehydrogenase (short-subunit alcohol dehydrogenase family)